MEGRRIEVWNPEDISDADLEHTVLNKDAVSREEIRKYAKTIAKEFHSEAGSDADKLLLVLDMLGTDRMLRRLVLSKEDLSGLTKEDMESALQPIREALLEELGNDLEPDEYALIARDIKNMHLNIGEQELEPTRQVGDDDKEIMNANRIAKLLVPKSKRGQEQVFRSAVVYENANPETKAEILRAHEMLQDAQDAERETAGSYFPGVIREISFDAKTGKSVVEELNMRDLNDLIMSRESASGPREVSKILSIFSDVATAARWLEDHGLMLEDIKPANIGLAKDTEGRERVLFHDLDGLHPIGVTDRLFTYSGDEFAPPEFAGGAIPATGAKEMVYQLGVSLVFTVRLEMTNFSNNMSRESYIDLLTLAEDMVQENPDDRPDLAECKRRFDEINSSMGLEALAA